MCEILLTLKKICTHADPDKDRAGNYTALMPVDIFPDGAEYGRMQHKPTYLNEVRTFPAMGVTGDSFAQIPNPGTNAACPNQLTFCKFGTLSVIEHAVVFRYKNIIGTIFELTARKDSDITWKNLSTNQTIEPFTDFNRIKRYCQRVSARLTFDQPLASDVTSVSLTNDPAQWPGHTGVLKIPGVPVEKVRALIMPQYVDDTGNPYQLEGPDGLADACYRRREFHIPASLVPQDARNTMITEGELTITKTQARNFFRKVRDELQQYDGFL